MDLSKRVAVITGGAGGIGAAAAREFAAQGYAVAILDIDDDRGRELAAALENEHGAAQFWKCDVAQADDVDHIATRIQQQWGGAQVLITSAALIPDSEAIMDMDISRHDRMWQVNYHGTVHACRSFGRQMIGQRHGAIVTLGSINSLLPLPLPAYNPGKAAIARLTQLLAAELGRHNIRVNCVAPTYVMTAALQARIDAGTRDLGKIMGTHALDRLPTPEDVSAAMAFLCSDQARMITGVLLPVDAGWSASVSYRSYAGGVPWER